jgi:SsrA-binding protein
MILNKNQKAYFEYHISDKFTAGIKLTGPEVKAVRLCSVSISEAFCRIQKGEIMILGMHIAPYMSGPEYNPIRERKLLLNKKEILKLDKLTQVKGLTIVPLSIFLNKTGFIKVEIGVGKGKKVYDKKNTIIEREAKRDIKNY